jgi:two-component system, NtrC family, response regulator
MQGNILIIDDEEKLRKLLSEFLGLEGYKIFQALTGRVGFKAFKPER